jgi:hypothetical protein
MTVITARKAPALLQLRQWLTRIGLTAMVDRKTTGYVEQIGDAVDHAHLAVGIGHHPDLDQRQPLRPAR